MIRLYVDDAISLVRKNMDEVDTGVASMLETPATTSIDEVVRRTIPEAVNAVNRLTAAYRLQGLEVRSFYAETTPATYHSDFKKIEIASDGTVSFEIDEEHTGPWLRLVGLKALDSPITIVDNINELSPEAHMQLNPYTRGTWDEPRLVGLQGKRLRFTYHTLKEETIAEGGALHGFDLDTYVASHDNTAPFPFDITYIPECEKERGRLYVAAVPQVSGAYYLISDGLMDAVINQLTAMVLAIYGQTEKSKIFYDNIKLSVL